MSRRNSMNRKNSIAIVVIMVIIFVIIGVADIISTRDKQKNCTQSVTAVVTHINRSQRKKRSNSRRVSKKTVYTPYFSYEVDGKTYEGYAASVSSSATYKVGDKIQIKVDPEKPSKYLVLSDKSTVGGSVTTIIVALLMLVVALIPKKQNSIR